MWISTIKPYGDLIAAVGALLLFFSWLATNILGERLKSVKDSYLNANATWRLHTKLDEIHASVQGVEGDAIYMQRDLAQLRFDNLSPRDQEHDRAWYKRNDLIRDFATTQINALQIDHGSAFCALMLEQSSIDKSRGDWTVSLQENCHAIDLLKQRKDQVIARASSALKSDDNSSVEQGIETARNELGPLINEFASLVQLAVKAGNERLEELQGALRKAEARARLANRFAVGFYVIGSIMVLAGTVISKLLN